MGSALTARAADPDGGAAEKRSLVPTSLTANTQTRTAGPPPGSRCLSGKASTDPATRKPAVRGQAEVSVTARPVTKNFVHGDSKSKMLTTSSQRLVPNHFETKIGKKARKISMKLKTMLMITQVIFYISSAFIPASI